MQALIGLVKSIVMSIYAWLFCLSLLFALLAGGWFWLLFGGLLVGAIVYNVVSDQG